MQNLKKQNFQMYNHFYTNQENQYLFNKNKDIFQNPQNNKSRAFSPNVENKTTNKEYSYLNKKEIPLKNSDKQNLLSQNNKQTFQNYSNKQNISPQSNPQNYFSPIPKKMPENINLQNYNYLTNKYPEISKYNPKKNRKTLILDLDETLVHSGFHPFNRKSDFILNIKVDGKNHTIYVLKRPYVEEFLSEIAPYYDIIIFTASISEYASPLLDLLDKKKLTTGRLFRQHCLFNHGLYLKDIKIIQKDLKDVIIIDNNPVSYVMNQDNGLPILTWYDDLNDKELINFIPLLKYLSTEDDVREVIKKIVDKQSTKIKFEIVDELIKQKIKENNNYKDMIYQTNDNFQKVSFSNNNLKSQIEHNYNSNYNQNYINNNNYNENKYDIKISNNFDINKEYNINKIITDEEKKIKNYFNDNNNFYKYNNYNNSIHDSLSNMTYNEIQNEGTIDTEREYINDNTNLNKNIKQNNNINNANKPSKNYVIQKAINYDNLKHYEEKNKENNFKQKEFLNKDNKINKKVEIGTQVDSNYEYQINNSNNFRFNNKLEENQFNRNYSSNTYNPNMRKSYYNYNINEQKYKNNNQIPPKEEKNNYNYEERYFINRDRNGDKYYYSGNAFNYINENNKFLENITFEKKGKDDNLRDNYLKSYQQKLLKLRMNENNNQHNNLSNNNNANVNNIHIYQNKDIKSQYNQNMNYQNNNNITRNHSINSLNYRRNNMNLINFNNNNNQLNKVNNFYNQRFLNDKNQDDLVKIKEKIYKQDAKDLEENNVQKNNNLRFFKTQTNFMQNYKSKDNNIFKVNNSNQLKDFRFNNNFRRNNEEKEQRIIQPKLNNYFNDNELNRSFSGKKDLINNKTSNIDLDRKARERKKYDFTSYHMDRNESNQVNIRNVNNLNSMKFMNERKETDINEEKRNDNFYKNNLENMNENQDNINKKSDYSGGNNIYFNEYKQKFNNYKEDYINNYNNKSNSKYQQNLSRTEERKFYRSSSSKPYNNNNNYLNNNENSRIPRNYNNININNYNFYNSFIGNNKENNEGKKIFNNKYRIQYYINKDDDQENPLNRSSSYFHPKTNYYSLLNKNGNSYTQNVLKKNHLIKSKFLNNLGDYGAF